MAKFVKNKIDDKTSHPGFLNMGPYYLWLLTAHFVFANSLDPDQARQNVRPDLDPNRWYSNSVTERIS